MTHYGKAGEPERRATRLDSFAPWQIRRQFGLRGVELAILMALVLQADWRDEHWRWEGTITQLHEDTGFSRRAIRSTNPEAAPGALDVLEAKRLIVIEREFGRGQYTSGQLRLPIYEWLVKVHASQMRSRQSARMPDELFAPDARPVREHNAPSMRAVARSRAAEQGERENHGIGQWGNEVEGPLSAFDDTPALTDVDAPPLDHADGAR